jgi:hypothetical protein
VALPSDARNREQLEWVTDEVLEHGGTSAIWLGVPASAADERKVAKARSTALAAEYATIADEAAAARRLDAAGRRKALRRLRRELRQVRARDHFPPPKRESAVQAVEELAALIEVDA